VRRWLAAACALVALPAAAADAPTFTVRLLTPETALKAAQAALAKCRAEGFQASIAVVDRSGVLQAFLRDRFASPHSIEIAQRKAQTAASFRMDTAALDRELQPGRPTAGMRALSSIVAVAGGKPIEAGGALLGAIGVSGAPGPQNDELCAAAGVAAIVEDLEF
jgi:uncharacterized protein GlcG (DUF336 family)